MARAIVALTLLIEGVTAFFRFGLGFESTRDTAGTIGRLTFGLRIHHGFIGLLLLLVAIRLNRGPWRDRGLILGAALLLSDLIHHFVVLWLITGSPGFDLWYPR